jgi:hypothetical protein
MISQALAVLVTALGLKKAGHYSEALQSFDQALETLLGLNANLVKHLDDSQLLAMLTFLGRLDLDRLLVLADIYHEEAEVYALQGQAENSLFASQRCLRLYLEIALASETTLGLELIQKIEAQRRQLNTLTLPIETRLALLDYLDRLLASEDDFLIKAGLSRLDLRAAFSSLDSPDLH